MNRTNQLRQAVEQERQFLISQIMSIGLNKMDDGRQLYEVPIPELRSEWNYLKKKAVRPYGRVESE